MRGALVTDDHNFDVSGVRGPVPGGDGVLRVLPTCGLE